MSEDPTLTARGDYARHSEDTWLAAGEAYCEGEGAASVCRRFGIQLSTFYDHARREGWTRGTIGVPADRDADVDTDPAVMAEAAWRHAAEAVARGDRIGARSWTRIAADLRATAAEALALARQDLAEEVAAARRQLIEAGEDTAELEREALLAVDTPEPPPPADRLRRGVATLQKVRVAERFLLPAGRPWEASVAISHGSHDFFAKEREYARKLTRLRADVSHLALGARIAALQTGADGP